MFPSHCDRGISVHGRPVFVWEDLKGYETGTRGRRKGPDCTSKLVMSTQTELETEDQGSQCITPALLPVGVQTSYASVARHRHQLRFTTRGCLGLGTYAIDTRRHTL